VLKLFIFLSLVLPAYAQLPDKGTVADLKGKTRYYLDADADAAKPISKELKRRGFTEVSKAADADFVIEFRTLSQKEKGDPVFHVQTNTVRRCEMTAYFIRDGQKVVAWSGVKEGGEWSLRAELALPRRFVDDLKKSH
jgi:hypothetical protein